MSEPSPIQRLDRLIRDVRAIRAERWLREWPNGHPDRPKAQPDFVRQYLAEREAPTERT